jgi:hypothetical protein
MSDDNKKSDVIQKRKLEIKHKKINNVVNNDDKQIPKMKLLNKLVDPIYMKELAINSPELFIINVDDETVDYIEQYYSNKK